MVKKRPATDPSARRLRGLESLDEAAAPSNGSRLMPNSAGERLSAVPFSVVRALVPRSAESDARACGGGASTEAGGKLSSRCKLESGAAAMTNLNLGGCARSDVVARVRQGVVVIDVACFAPNRHCRLFWRGLRVRPPAPEFLRILSFPFSHCTSARARANHHMPGPHVVCVAHGSPDIRHRGNAPESNTVQGIEALEAVREPTCGE